MCVSVWGGRGLIKRFLLEVANLGESDKSIYFKNYLKLELLRVRKGC
jgi:hypothetical protein